MGNLCNKIWAPITGLAWFTFHLSSCSAVRHPNTVTHLAAALRGGKAGHYGWAGTSWRRPGTEPRISCSPRKQTVPNCQTSPLCPLLALNPSTDAVLLVLALRPIITDYFITNSVRLLKERQASKTLDKKTYRQKPTLHESQNPVDSEPVVSQSFPFCKAIHLFCFSCPLAEP